jgi:hypothetical protein
VADDSAYIRNLKAYTRQEPDIEHRTALEKEMYHESDRASVVMFGSQVELALEKLLKKKFRSGLSNEKLKGLFEYNAPLASFSAKIDVAYALNLIGPVALHDLHIVRTLRNEFAHSRMPLTYDHPAVKAVCAELKTPDTGKFFIPLGYLTSVTRAKLKRATDINQPKTRFIATCFAIAERLYIMRGTEAEFRPVATPLA